MLDTVGSHWHHGCWHIKLINQIALCVLQGLMEKSKVRKVDLCYVCCTGQLKWCISADTCSSVHCTGRAICRPAGPAIKMVIWNWVPFSRFNLCLSIIFGLCVSNLIIIIIIIRNVSKFHKQSSEWSMGEIIVNLFHCSGHRNTQKTCWDNSIYMESFLKIVYFIA